MRVALIGTGFGARIVAGCYRDAGMAVEIVSPRDGVAVRAACADDVDLVSVHSPPFLHAEHVGIALDHRRDVLCDKPFGVSAVESRAMLARAEGVGGLHFLNFEFRADPSRIAIKRLIDEGAIGAVRHVHWTAFNAGSRVPLRRHGWLFDKTRGGGWIGAFGSHVFDALRWLVGEIETVSGETRIDVAERPDADDVLHPSTAEDAFVARLRFVDGATALVDTAFAAPATLPPRITIFGTDGLIEAIGATEIRVRGSAADRDIHFEPFDGDPHLPAMRPWAVTVRDAIAARRQIAPNFHDGVACAEVMDRLRAAR
jgi:predicted dehydrogenase